MTGNQKKAPSTKCNRSAILSKRSDAASRNELHTAIAGAEDAVDTRSAPPLVALGPDSTDLTQPWRKPHRQE